MNREQKKFQEVIKARESRKRRMKFREQLEVLSHKKPRVQPAIKGARTLSWFARLWAWLTK